MHFTVLVINDSHTWTQYYIIYLNEHSRNVFKEIKIIRITVKQ